jgi:hypothetical protein
MNETTGIPYITIEDQNDEILKLVPHDVQKEFLELPDSIYEALYGGAAYGGKTFILVLLPLLRGFYKYRGWKGLLLRRELTDLEKEVVRLSKEYFPITGAKYNETKHSWYWPEYGSYFDFSHIQHLKDVKAYDSAQYNYGAFDELTHFEEAMYLYFVGSRVRPGSSFNVAFVRNGTNPGGVGHTFVHNRFVKPCESGYKIIYDRRTGLKRIFIPAKLEDNPYGLAYDPDYAKKLEILPEAEKRAKKYGDWHSFEGSVFTTFRPIKFPGEPDNAIHTCKNFVIPEWWPRILTVDWGKRALCHALWSAISPDNRLYIYRERSWRGVDVPFWATEIGQASEFENIITFVLCGSGFQEHGISTVAQQVKNYSGMTPVGSGNTPNSRVSTLQLVHDFMRWEQKPRKNPTEPYDHGKAQEIFRRFGEVALSRYVEQFKQYEPETNIPKLQILLQPNSDTETVAPVLVETLPSCVYDEHKKEDIKEFDGDDPIDNLRYTCKFATRYMNGQMGDEMVERQKVQSVIEKYQNSNDTTRFYRQMEYLEKVAKSTQGFGVKRHSARRRY